MREKVSEDERPAEARLESQLPQSSVDVMWFLSQKSRRISLSCCRKPRDVRTARIVWAPCHDRSLVWLADADDEGCPARDEDEEDEEAVGPSERARTTGKGSAERSTSTPSSSANLYASLFAICSFVPVCSTPISLH